MQTYNELVQQTKPEAAVALALILLRIYDADRTGNCGAVNGEAILCQSFRDEAKHALIKAGVIDHVR